VLPVVEDANGAPREALAANDLVAERQQFRREPASHRGVQLAARRTPTLVLRGGDSIVTSAAGMTALADGLPNRQVREIKGGSHMLLLEHPEKVRE
jgi:pimeloyl-ACP methyl ester carboxylesterase